MSVCPPAHCLAPWPEHEVHQCRNPVSLSLQGLTGMIPDRQACCSFFFFLKDSKQVPWNSFIFHYSQPYESLSSVIQLCPTLCNPMDWSMPGFPVHYQLPEFTQIHVHQLDDAIQPSQPLVIPFLFLPSIFPSVRVFSNESFLHIRWSKYWSFSFSISPSSEHPGLIYFRMDWLDLLAVQGTLKSLQHHSSKASIL